MVIWISFTCNARGIDSHKSRWRSSRNVNYTPRLKPKGRPIWAWLWAWLKLTLSCFISPFVTLKDTLSAKIFVSSWFTPLSEGTNIPGLFTETFPPWLVFFRWVSSALCANYKLFPVIAGPDNLASVSLKKQWNTALILLVRWLAYNATISIHCAWKVWIYQVIQNS